MPNDAQSARRCAIPEEKRPIASSPSITAPGDETPWDELLASLAPTSRPDWPRRALVVEDDAGIRNLLTRALEIDGYDVVGAVDGIDGWQRMNENPAALVITDFLLPRLDGLDFARRLRAAFGATTKIVIMSSLTSANQRIIAENVADAFLPKPIDVPHLLQVVATLWD